MFQLQLIDIIIIFVLLGGAIIGLKKGFFKTSVSFIGVLVVLFLAYVFKNPLSEFMYLHFPFLNFGGEFANITIVNILIYEAIAFAFLVLIFGFLMKLIIVLTGLLDKIADLTHILGFLSQIFGFVFGFLKTYIIVFAIFFILQYFVNIYPLVEQGLITSKMVHNTPILSKVSEKERVTFDEILFICFLSCIMFLVLYLKNVCLTQDHSSRFVYFSLEFFVSMYFEALLLEFIKV